MAVTAVTAVVRKEAAVNVTMEVEVEVEAKLEVLVLVLVMVMGCGRGIKRTPRDSYRSSAQA